MRMLVILLVLSTGCGTFQLGGKPDTASLLKDTAPKNCKRYSTSYLIFGSVAAGSGALAGASGISTIASSDDRVKTGLAATSVSFGVIGAVATFLAGYYASAWSKCSQ